MNAADARLIAAAPYLMVALDNLVSACELPGEHCEIEQTLPSAIAALEMALNGPAALLGSQLSDMQKMVRLLTMLGIEMSVEGCGCCGSPSVSFSFAGQKIFEGDDASFNTAG